MKVATAAPSWRPVAVRENSCPLMDTTGRRSHQEPRLRQLLLDQKRHPMLDGLDGLIPFDHHHALRLPRSDLPIFVVHTPVERLPLRLKPVFVPARPRVTIIASFCPSQR